MIEESDTREFNSKQIPLIRLIMLSILTIGVYLIGWMFKNNDWLEDNNLKIDHPIWFFIPIANFIVLFRQIRSIKNKLQTKKKPLNWSPGWVITGVIVLSLLSGNLGAEPSLSKIILVGISYSLPIIPLMWVQNSLNKKFEKQEKEKAHWVEFTNNQVIWAICGLVLWVLIFLIKL